MKKKFSKPYQSKTNSQGLILYGRHAVLAALENPARKIHKLVCTSENAVSLRAKYPNLNIITADKKDIDKLNRNRKGIEQIYQGKQGNIQKRNSLLIGAASLILTISGGVDVIRTILKTFSDKLPKWLNYTTIDKYLMFIIVCISIVSK